MWQARPLGSMWGMNETSAPPPDPTSGPDPVGAPGDPAATGTPQTQPVDAGPGAPSSGADSFFDSVRRAGLFRSEERWVGGVAGGIALRLGIDPLVVRGLFGVATLLGGVGLVLYGVGWLLLPEQRDGRIHIQQLIRGDFDAAVIGGFAAILLGIGVPDRVFMPWWGDHGWWRGLSGFAAVVVIVAVLIAVASRNRGGAGPTTSLPRTPPFGPGAPPPPFGGPPPQYGRPAPYADPTPPPAAPTPVRQPAYGTATPAVVRHHTEGISMSAAPPAAPAPQAYGPGPVHPGQGPVYLPPRPPLPPGPVTSLPVAPHRAGPGFRPVGLVVALSLLVWAGLLYAERIGRFDKPVLLTAAAAMVVLAGLGIVIAGAFGRTSGGLGALAVVTLLVIVPVSFATNASWDNSAFVGDLRYHPTDAATASDGYSVFAGQVVVDLTDVPTSGPVVEVPLHLTAGDLRIIMPDDGAYTARVRQSAGDFTWLDERTVRGVSGSDWRTYTSPAVADGAEPEITLEITVGAGTLRVEED